MADNKDEQEMVTDLEAEGNNYNQALEDERHLRDMTMAVLMNPVILDCIFTQLNIPELKKIRQVCFVWGDIGARVLGRKTFFTILPHRLHDQLLPPFNVLLAKNVKILATGEPEYYDAGDEVDKFVQIFQRMDKVVQTIHLSTQYQLIPYFVDTLNLFAFPKLKSIRLFRGIDRPRPCGRERSILPCPDWRQRSSIKSAEFVTPLGPATDRSQSIVQSMVNSFPNMEKFLVMGNVYPDFGNVTNLKRLEHWSYDKVDFSGLVAMLTSARKTIEELKLYYISRTWTPGKAEDEISLPCMPNLVTLGVFSCDVYRFPSTLCEERLPKLKHISIYSLSSDYTVREFLADLYKRHDGIVSLNLSTHAGPELVKRAAELFPNVEKLIVDLEPIDFTEEEFKEVLESYAGFKNLKKSIITFCEIDKFTQIEAALEGLSRWKGSKSMTFLAHRLNGCSIKEFSVTSKAAFLLSKEFESVKISGHEVSIELLEEMEAYIKEHNLPIYFEEECLSAHFRAERLNM